MPEQGILRAALPTAVLPAVQHADRPDVVTMHAQQMQAMHALERELQDALTSAQRGQAELLERMDAARLLVQELFHAEAEETRQYVDATRLQMRAIRDVLQLEMESARRDVAAALQQARRNATRARHHAEQVRSETKDQLRLVHARKRDREQRHGEAIEQAKRDAAQRAESIVAEIANDDSQWTQRDAINSAGARGIELEKPEPVWVLPFILSLFMGACLCFAFIQYQARRAKTTRRQRVLYSEQLKSHFANGNGDRETRPRVRRRTRASWAEAKAAVAESASPVASSPTSSDSSTDSSSPSQS